MSRSSILAAVIFTAGMVAFLLLVSGVPLLSWNAPSAPADEVIVAAEVADVEQVTVEPGTWISYEAATYVSHDGR